MKLLTFWKVLTEEAIQIPLFQRDYAQGRVEKEALRKKFLGRLFEALRNPVQKKVKLDFVFGVQDDSAAFQPLDGQQRLTTLWLLHWYIAQRAGAADAAKHVLSKFSYETRDSSALFCRALSLSDGWNGENVEKFIKNQKWYFDRYDLDPSVRGFIRSLVTIERCVQETDDFKLFWRMLTEVNECPIKFFVRDDMPESVADDLYIKMNSRGKGLTEFENFKADMLGIEMPGDDQVRLFSMREAALVDNAWTDIFWAHQEDEEVDDIFFQFFKRYLLAWRIAETGNGGRLPPVTGEAVLGEDLYIHLHEGRDYVSIEPYSSVLVADMKNDLKSFFEAYSICKDALTEDKIDRIVAPYWSGIDESSPYTLIPRYGACGNIKVVLDQKLLQGMPVLYAACRFLEKNLARITVLTTNVDNENKDEICSELKGHFERWMRFVWNLTESSFISTDAEMVSMVRFLREISDGHTWDIVDYLASLDPSTLSQTTSRDKSYLAEVQKARLRKYEIERLSAGEQVYGWSQNIDRAEATGFVHGEIEFLLPPEVVAEYLSGGDAARFERQVNNMEVYFGADGIREDRAIGFIVALMKGVDHFWGSNVAYGFYDNEFLCRTDKDIYREVIFRDPVMSRSVARILASDNVDGLTEVPFVDVSETHDGNSGEDHLRTALLNSGVLLQPGVVGRGNKSSWRFRAYATVSFYRKSGAGKNSCARYYFDTEQMRWVQGCKRNEFLLSGDPFRPYEGDVVPGLNVCVPEDRYNTYFIFTDPISGQERKFSWNMDNIIRLLNDEWEVVEGRYFGFNYDFSRDEFVQGLSNLMNQE